MSETLLESIAKVVESNKISTKALIDINEDLSRGKHVDSSWIKDAIELNSGIGIVERSNFSIEIKKLKAENKKLREALEEVTRESIELECGKPYWIARKTLEELK
jgi:hypothetical protein